LEVTKSGEHGIKQKSNKGVVILIEPDASARDALVILLRGEAWVVNCLDQCGQLAAALESEFTVAVISESSLPRVRWT